MQFPATSEAGVAGSRSVNRPPIANYWRLRYTPGPAAHLDVIARHYAVAVAGLQPEAGFRNRL